MGVQVTTADVGGVCEVAKLATLGGQENTSDRLDGHAVFAAERGQFGDEAVVVDFDLQSGVAGMFDDLHAGSQVCCDDSMNAQLVRYAKSIVRAVAYFLNA